MKSTLNLMVALLLLILYSCDDASDNNNVETQADTSTTKIISNEDQPIHPVSFYAPDSLKISGIIYQNTKNTKCILYCHQAGYNKSEYHEIAEKLLKKGYNGLAIDQRSGGTISGYIINNENETSKRAKARKLPTKYLNAEQDIIAAIEYLEENGYKEIILWGSSYSASLALKIGTNHPNVKAIIAFSPGEYFRNQGVIIKSTIKTLNKPTFVTSSNLEAQGLTTLMNEINQELVTQYIPTSAGKHGSKALWESYKDYQSYWNALNNFLARIQ